MLYVAMAGLLFTTVGLSALFAVINLVLCAAFVVAALTSAIFLSRSVDAIDRIVKGERKDTNQNPS